MITLEKASAGLLDFHTHSTNSDGGYTPAQLVKEAFEKGISALALTDHNVITGLPEFIHACKSKEIFCIPFGVEIYAALPAKLIKSNENDAPDLIILGKNPDSSRFLEYQLILSDYRKNIWLPGHIESLKKIGFKIPKFNLIEQSKELGTPKILHDVATFQDNLKHLVNYVLSLNNSVNPDLIFSQPIRFMNKYLYAPGKPAYKKRIEGFTVDDAISLSEAMNCKIFIAHPGGEYGSLSREVMSYYVERGAHGIEVRSYFNSSEQNNFFDKFANENNLLKSGGSDCHGDNGPFKIGIYDRPNNQLSKEILKELWENLPG